MKNFNQKTLLLLSCLLTVNIANATENNSQAVNSQIIIQFAPTPKQQEIINKAKTAKEKMADLKITRADLMQKLPTEKLQALSLIAKEQFVDLRPYPLGGRVLTFKHNLTKEQMAAVIERLKKVPGIVDVEENISVNMDEILTFNLEQWNLYDTSSYHGGNSSVYKVGDIFYGDNFFDGKSFVNYTGKNVVVAVLDTGYVPHPNFVSHLLAGENGKYGYDFISDCRERGSCPVSQNESPNAAPSPDGLDLGNSLTFADVQNSKGYFNGKPTDNGFSTWHGTNVIGAIIGQHIDAKSNRGGAPDAMVVPVRMSGKGVGGTAGRLDDIINAMLWAGGIHPTITNPHPAKVFNMSFSDNGRTCLPSYQQTFDALNTQGITAVVTAGNTSQLYTFRTPAVCKDTTQNVVTVAALNTVGRLAGYSNGGNVTIAASGGDDKINGTDGFGVWTTTYRGKDFGTAGNTYDYGWKNGTSLAAPLVTAAIADMLSANPNLSPQQIIHILRATAKAIPVDKKRSSKGIVLGDEVGRLDVIKAVEMAKNYLSSGV